MCLCFFSVVFRFSTPANIAIAVVKCQEFQHNQCSGPRDPEYGRSRAAIRKRPCEFVGIAFMKRDAPAEALARMQSPAYLHTKVLLAFQFVRRHELDAHDLQRIWNRFFELEVSRLGSNPVAEKIEYLLYAAISLTQMNHVQQKIEIPYCAGSAQSELHRLRSRQNEIFSGRSQRDQEFEQIRLLWFRDHCRHLGTMTFSKRYAACFWSRPPCA